MVQVTIHVSEELADVLGSTTEARAQRLKEHAIIEEYRAGRLSQREVGTMLSLDYWQTEKFLADRGVPLNYSVEDLEADRATWAELRRIV